jgi:hypothetical protein
MNAKPYFQNIQSEIAQKLNGAISSIYVSVAWFTDNILFDILCQKAKAGVNVTIVIYDDEINQKLYFPFLKKYGGRIYKISEHLMHNKFCVIDNNTIITGSYNWTYSAANHEREENIIIIQDVPELAAQYIQQFQQIIQKYFGKQYASHAKAYDAIKVSKRLEIIKKMIELEEYEDITNHISKIETYALPDAILQILYDLKSNDFDNGLLAIQRFQKRSKSLTNYEDSQINELKLAIKILEIQVAAIDSEIQEGEKLIHDFGIQHHRYLGELIRQLLLLRKEKLAKIATENHDRKADAEEAKKDYEDFSKDFQYTKQKKYQQLNDADQKTIKKLHRKAVFACHPDKMPFAMKAQAEAIFRELQQAYEENDLERVRQISEQLEKGIAFDSAVENINTVENLSILRQTLRDKVKDLLKKLGELKDHETYILISDIADWETYFEDMKRRLEEELNFLIGENLEI